MPDYKIAIIVEGRDQGASSLLDRLGSSLKNMGTIAGGIIGAGMISRIGESLKGIAANAFQATADFQSMSMGLQSLAARELVNADATLQMKDALAAAGPKAKAMMEELEKIAMLSPYELQTVQSTYKTAMAFGYASDEAGKFTKAILDVGAGTGATNETLERISYNFAQMRMQGKITGVDFRQLAMAGFDLNSVLRYVGKSIGENIENYDDFNSALARGKVSWAQFTDLFAKYAETNFGGSSERMSRTLNGLKSTFNDVFRLTMPKVLGPAAEAFTGFANKVLDGFLKIRDSGLLEQWGEQLGQSLGGLDKLGGKISKAISKGIDIAGIFSKHGFKTGLQSLLMNILPADQAFPIIDGLDDLDVGIQTAITNIKTFLDENGPAFKTALDQIIGPLTEGLPEISLGDILSGLGDALASGTQWLVDNGPKIAEGVQKISDAVVSFGAWVVENKDSILAFLTGFGTALLTIQLYAGAAGVITAIQTALIGLGPALAAAGPIMLVAIGVGMLATALQQYGVNILGADAANATFFQQMQVGFFGLLLDASNTVYMIGEIIRIKFQEAADNAALIINGMKDIVVAKFQEIHDGIASKLEEAKSTAGRIIGGISGFFDGVVKSIDGVIKRIQDLIDTISKVSIPSWWGAVKGGETKARAMGGPVSRGQPYIVGERGPELFMPPSNGRIIPNRQLNGASPAGNTNNYYMPVYTDQSPNVIQNGLAVTKALASV